MGIKTGRDQFFHVKKSNFVCYTMLFYDIMDPYSEAMHMFLKKDKKQNGRVYLSLVHGYRDDSRITRTRTVESLGYLDELIKTYPDPIAHFTQIANQRNNENNEETIIEYIKNQKIDSKVQYRKNLGYCILQFIYKELQLNLFLAKKQKTQSIEYKLNDSLRLLTYARILKPSSIKSTFENKDVYFEDFDLSLKDIYRSLDKLLSYKEDLLVHLNQVITKTLGRDTSITYYDCTNYYFEITYNDEDQVNDKGEVIKSGLRKRGPSKEHRPNPLVGMGLLLDKEGIPLSYDVFPGNQSEKVTLRPILNKTKSKFGLDKVIVVADRGLNTSDNIFFNNTEYDGYIYSKSIRGADDEFKSWAIEPFIGDSLVKSRIHTFDITIVRDGKRKSRATVIQKQVVYYSEKYAIKAKHERNLVMQKAKSLIDNPGKYTRATSVGAAGYINNIVYDKKTGEIIAKDLSLNLTKISEEEKYDGYYSIVTSETHMSDQRIIDTYKGLWKIEESFRVIKSEFKARPIYLSTEDHIKAHFLICFIALVIIRILEKNLNNKYSSGKIIESLNNLSGSYIKDNYYLFDYRDSILKDIELFFDVNFNNTIMSRKNIRKFL